MDTTLFHPTQAHWNFYPLIMVVVGTLQFIYRKYMNPVSEDTLDELLKKSAFGSDFFTYSPIGGVVAVAFGFVLFLIFNWSMIF